MDELNHIESNYKVTYVHIKISRQKFSCLILSQISIDKLE